MKLLFATSEMWPLVKTGGLADVAYALPAALGRCGVDARVVMPAYRGLVARFPDARHIAQLEVLGQSMAVWEVRLSQHPEAAAIWLVDHQWLFAREGDPYHDGYGRPFDDNPWRFGSFCHAVVQLALGAGGWTPDVVHANDWQTGLVAPLLRSHAQRPRSVFTIHNLAYQGSFDRSQFDLLRLPHWLWSMEGVEAWGRLSFMKGGITCSDRITTVSPTYALEIQTPGFGCGLHELLRAHSAKLSGILNGIDVSVWNPARDPYLEHHFSARNLVSGKRANREALQQELGLDADPDALLIGLVGRLADQKGTDVVVAALPQLIGRSVQFAFLASGDSGQEQALRYTAAGHPGRVAARFGYDERVAHLIEAGADAFLMASRYEPCGLNQMYSQRYGTIPLVRRTGGLADTVVDATEHSIADGTATGICFDHTDIGGIMYAVHRAQDLYAQRNVWRAMQRAGMKRDFSWDAAAAAYQQLYAAA